ncbi:hypothetical protein M011DRAFT_474424 [Sporormia fimetaria CBS 119925]|uniref:Cytochrome P450 n=1 Tax=Sporormia fimetaria CBS 119925 TaxID=1340428 RepID=A0A6A6VN05_9PLEO|nr:hypothetical protein M011DRAFT_474424 [Sporormia fimetaria CBS 119925]
MTALYLARRMVHRGVATHFVTELKGAETYLTTAINYSEHGFKHNFDTPKSWGVDKALKDAKRMISPIINKQLRQEREKPTYEKPDDFLQHFMDGGKDVETTVQRLMVTYLESGLSTIIAVGQVLFDLRAHPEYVGVLREETLEVLKLCFS